MRVICVIIASVQRFEIKSVSLLMFEDEDNITVVDLTICSVV